MDGLIVVDLPPNLDRTGSDEDRVVATIAAVVAQQFDVAAQVLSHGLVPILEPEVTVTIPDKADAEAEARMVRSAVTTDSVTTGPRSAISRVSSISSHVASSRVSRERRLSRPRPRPETS